MTAVKHFDTESYTERLYMDAARKFDYRKNRTPGDWERWREGLRSGLMEKLGLSRIVNAMRGLPFEARTSDLMDYEDYTERKMIITAEPGVELPFYFMLPKHGRPPYPLVLTPHGHNRRGKEVYAGHFEDAEEEKEALDGERDIARQAVMQGYAVMAMDVRGFNELARSEEFEAGANNSCDDLQKRAYLFGRTLIGERVYDVIRLLDYAATLPDLLLSRIAITGNSGGGTVSLFSAALDERIAVCVPGSYLSTFRASLLSVHHCLCNYVPGILDLGEMYDIAGLVAPRPLLFVNGKNDTIFPVDAARRSFAHVAEAYERQGHPGRCSLFVGDGGHRYYKAPVWPFIRQHFNELTEDSQ